MCFAGCMPESVPTLKRQKLGVEVRNTLCQGPLGGRLLRRVGCSDVDQDRVGVHVLVEVLEGFGRAAAHGGIAVSQELPDALEPGGHRRVPR